MRRGTWMACWIAGLGLLANCKGDDACERGTESCPCFPNLTCHGDLSCKSGFCVDLDGKRDGGWPPDAGRGSASGSDSRPGSGSDAGMHSDGGSMQSADGGRMQSADGGQGTIEQGEPCKRSAECAPIDDPCRTPVCVGGVCDSARKPEGSPAGSDTIGDCERVVCGAGGDLLVESDPNDVPMDDGDPCTVAACDGAEPVHVPAPEGTPAPPSAQTAGDCLRVVCDGSGDLISVPDDGDVSGEPTEEPCTVNACDDGSPALAAAQPGTPCGSGLICDDQAECVACSANGMACTASSQCCGGLCTAGMICATCTQNMGDCDGDPANNCEQSLNVYTHCGRCGNDCSGRPFVHQPNCTSGTCSISRCESGYADVDGVFENGCEEIAIVGPNGVYAACAAGVSDACGTGERCGYPASPSLVQVQLNPCTASHTDCHCAYPCVESTDCPAAPSGTAEPRCGSGYCYLRCTTAGSTCPDGMQCVEIGLSVLSNKVCVPD